MKWLYFLSICLTIQVCYAPPVTQKKEEEHDSEVNGLEDYMEYHRYLKEVVNALESDPDFRAKLEKADESEIRSGKIAEELEFVSHHVRTRLDELKRIELERLKQLVEQRRKLEDTNSIDIEDPMHHHVDRSNPHTFEIEDLKKLIAKTTADLAEADKKRKEEFKQYELEKEYRKQDKLNHTTEEERKKIEMEYQEMEKKHKNHEKLHEPGHKAQLEEVWEEQDQMQQDFDPKTFFMLHDLDGNGLWDQDEVKALFVKELDKMYQQNAPEDDWRERIEEMERMRESVFREMDANRDGFIDFHEFLARTNANDFKQDHGWQGLDEQRPFTDEELAEYIRQQQAMNNIPPAYQQLPPGGYHQQVPPQGYQQQHMQQRGYQQVPPDAYQQHIPQGGYQQQQHPHGGYQQQQVPQGGYQQQQIPQGGYQQQIPQGGYQQQVPQGGYNQHQIPQGGYQQQQQVPQGGQQQQVPQGGQQQQVPQGGQQQQVPQGGQQQLQDSQRDYKQQQVPQTVNQQITQSAQQAVKEQEAQVQGHPQQNQQQVIDQQYEQPKEQNLSPAHQQDQINRNDVHLNKL
ncbi:nucleobindin-2 [Diorhabda sublineata]|uniref:nucleobindin-2 n=1 Tax=Diorhabda sublineata TaxID=1163346 RepID=UPI0024E10B7A|nr:nucleobindin-2 [Diorhabda sublineata]XP_056637789.1 nucleobindin-2 [Diorhabda sublineata]XP_056637790.1 nucleobindin-2 [Diorhabda sublineata]